MKIFVRVFVVGIAGVSALVSYGESITLAEKQAVIQRVEKLLETKFFANLSGAADLKEAWRRLWNTTDYDSSFLGEPKRIALATEDREEFQKCFNMIASVFNVHLNLEESREVLEPFLRNIADFNGFSFRKKDTESAYQEYEVTAIEEDGMADVLGICAGDCFRFPSRDEELGSGVSFVTKVRRFPGNTPEEKLRDVLGWNVVFYRHGKLPKKIRLTLSLPTRPTGKPTPGYGKLGNVVLKDNVLTVRSFDLEDYGKEAVEEVMARVVNLPHLVIDLRDNPGGSLANMSHFLSFYLPQGTVYAEDISRSRMRRVLGGQKKRGEEAHRILKFRPQFRGQLAVLVNDFTTSAAEVVAHTLRAFLRREGRIVIIGQRTTGSVAPIRKNKLSDTVVSGFCIAYPSMTCFLANPENPGKLDQELEGIGVIPDVEVADPDSLDEYLRKANAWFVEPRVYPLVHGVPQSIEERITGSAPDTVIPITPTCALTTCDRIQKGMQVFGSTVQEVYLYPDSRLRLLCFDKPLQAVCSPLLGFNTASESLVGGIWSLNAFLVQDPETYSWLLAGLRGWNALDLEMVGFPRQVIEWIREKAGDEAVEVSRGRQETASASLEATAEGYQG